MVTEKQIEKTNQEGNNLLTPKLISPITLLNPAKKASSFNIFCPPYSALYFETTCILKFFRIKVPHIILFPMHPKHADPLLLECSWNTTFYSPFGSPLWEPRKNKPKCHFFFPSWTNNKLVLVPNASPITISGTFNSLFRVLCIFPSRYLCAIGLLPIFSLRRSLPPNLGCTPKQPDSKENQIFRNQGSKGLQGYHLLWRCFPTDFNQILITDMIFLKATTPKCINLHWLQPGLPPSSLAVTGGILFSFFSSPD